MRALLLFLATAVAAFGQCAMCFRTAQAAQSSALNAGIAVLLVPPIGILSAILYTAFRRKP